MSEEMTVSKEEKIQTTTGEIKLSPDIVRKFLVNGQGNVTDQEVTLFIALCKANKLNPFNKDAYLIKYSSEPATMIVSKDVFLKRAIANPNYNGMKSGIVVLKSDGNIQKREGSIYVDGEKILGAWCTVYRKDWENPVYQEVNFREYVGTKKTGEVNVNWKTKPAVMIMKVAEATALRKAFTDDIQGMYIEEEMEQTTVINEAKEEPQIIEDILGGDEDEQV